MQDFFKFYIKFLFFQVFKIATFKVLKTIKGTFPESSLAHKMKEKIEF